MQKFRPHKEVIIMMIAKLRDIAIAIATTTPVNCRLIPDHFLTAVHFFAAITKAVPP